MTTCCSSVTTTSSSRSPRCSGGGWSVLSPGWVPRTAATSSAPAGTGRPNHQPWARSHPIAVSWRACSARTHPLGADPLPHHVGGLDHGADQHRVGERGVHVVHERPVDLDGVQRQVAQQPERGPPGAEVVQRDLAAELAQRREPSRRLGGVAQRDPLGDLEAEQPRVPAAGREHPAQVLDQLVVDQLGGRDVQRDDDPVGGVGEGRDHVVQRALEDEQAELADQRPALGGLDDLVRRHRRTVVVGRPADQRLDRDHAAGRQVDDRLVVDLEGPLVQRQPDPSLDLAAAAPSAAGLAGRPAGRPGRSPDGGGLLATLTSGLPLLGRSGPGWPSTRSSMAGRAGPRTRDRGESRPAR